MAEVAPAAAPQGDKKQRKPRKKDESSKQADAAAGAAPVILEKVAAPDRAEHDAKIKELEAAIKAVQIKINTCMKTLNEKKEARQTFRDRRKEVLGKLRGISSERSRLVEERKALNSSLEKIEEERKKRQEAFLNLDKNLRYQSAEEIDRAIAAIEYRLATSTLSLKIEKDLIKEIQELRASKGTVKEFEEAKNARSDPGLKQNALELKKKRDDKTKEIQTVRATEGPLQTSLNDLKVRENEANEAIKALIQERRDAQGDLSKLNEELQTQHREYVKKERAFQRYQDQQRYLRSQQARKDREQRAIERAAQLEAEKEELPERHPYENEIYICEELVRYLKRIAPKEDDEEEFKEEASTTERNSDFKGKEAVPLQSRKKEDQFFLSEVAAPKKQPKKKARGRKNVKLTHIPDVFTQFSTIGLSAPLEVSEIATALKALQEKLEYYQTAPPPLSEKEKTEQKRKVEKEKQQKQAKDAKKSGDKEPSDADPAEAEERQRSRDLATSLEDDEQRRRVAEDTAAREEEVKERQRRRSVAAELEDAEQARRIAEEASGQVAATDKELSKEINAAVEEERARQVQELPEHRKRKSVILTALEEKPLPVVGGN